MFLQHQIKHGAQVPICLILPERLIVLLPVLQFDVQRRKPMLDQGVNQKKPPDPSVPVLERMNRLELIVHHSRRNEGRILLRVVVVPSSRGVSGSEGAKSEPHIRDR